MPNERADNAPADGDSLLAAPEPAFSEPWQARAFALAILASRQGCFSWSEWTRALSRELQSAADADYFKAWLCALQCLLVGKGAVGHDELGERTHAWEEAYRRTPHGAPVSLTPR